MRGATNFLAIVQHIALTAIATVKVVDMNIGLAYRQQIHVTTAVNLATCGSNCFRRITCLSSVSFIDLLNEEVTQFGILVFKVWISLKVFANTLNLTRSKWIGNEPSAKILVGICPFIVVHVMVSFR